MLENVGFELFFSGIRKFHAFMGEKFHAIVLKWVVRSRNDNAGLKIILAHEAGHARSGNYAGEGGRGASLRETGSKLTGDVRAGLAGVHADQDMGFAVFAIQIRAQRAACGKESGVVQRRRAGDSANAIGSEEFFGHGEEPAYLPCELRAADFRGRPGKSLTHGNSATFRCNGKMSFAATKAGKKPLNGSFGLRPRNKNARRLRQSARMC